MVVVCALLKECQSLNALILYKSNPLTYDERIKIFSMEIAAKIDSKDRMTALDVAYISFGSRTSKIPPAIKEEG